MFINVQHKVPVVAFHTNASKVHVYCQNISMKSVFTVAIRFSGHNPEGVRILRNQKCSL